MRQISEDLFSDLVNASLIKWDEAPTHGAIETEMVWLAWIGDSLSPRECALQILSRRNTIRMV